MNVSEKRLTGSGGIDLYYAEWSVEAPKAVVFLIHGLADHLGRAERLIDRLVSARYAVVGLDLRGHGKSGGARAYV
ncbi:MAG: alpha/beta hydrolase, partial [Rhodothermales bacterium]|nr:alpha/beta hydrolase [Rhodothermales bacterium]